MTKPHRPKAVVFDLGNVLLDFDYGKTVQRIKDKCKMSEPELRKVFSASPLFDKFEHGQMTPDEYFAEIQRITCYSGSFHDFAEFFGDIFTEAPVMLAWNEELRRKKIPRYILSNTNDLSIRFIKKRFPFFNQFDGYVFSHEHRVMKPATRIYEVVEEISKLRGPDLFYIDDRQENIHAAAARGWQAIHHVNPAHTLEIARGVGL
jgi:HAD superfamily hydrolase (TIGR01509 family)